VSLCNMHVQRCFNYKLFRINTMELSSCLFAIILSYTCFASSYWVIVMWGQLLFLYDWCAYNLAVESLNCSHIHWLWFPLCRSDCSGNLSIKPQTLPFVLSGTFAPVLLWECYVWMNHEVWVWECINGSDVLNLWACGVYSPPPKTAIYHKLNWILR